MPIYFYDQWYDVLSNFSAHAVEFESILYPILAKEVSNEKYKAAKDPNWSKKKLSVMESILRAKLDQHQEVRDALIKSGDEEIAEDSPVDSFWGRGKDGHGENQLGKLWMKIRSEL